MFKLKNDNKLRKFYLYTVKPKMLSVKHFFKSSIVFFQRHPRLKNSAIVASVFLIVIAISAIVNTFSRNYLNSNFDYSKYDQYTDEFWHNLSMNNGGYSRPVETLSYKDSSYGTDVCDINTNITFGHNLDTTECSLAGTGSAADPYQIDSINKFIYVRTLGSKAIGLYFIVTENLDFDGVALRPMDNGNNSNFFGGIIDGNFKHFKNVSLNINGSGSIVTNGLIPGLYGNSTHAAIVKNFIIDDVSFSLRSSMGDGVRAIGAAVGFIGPYSYAYNNGLLSGTITSTGITADYRISKGAYIGSLYGYLTDFSISNAYKNNSTDTTYVQENAINGVFNSYSYANFNLSGTNTGNVKYGGVLGSRIRNTTYMNADNSLLFNMNYYGKMTVSGNADYQFVYNGSQLISATISPHNSYYWFKGNLRDITTDQQSWAIAQDSDYLQSEGFVANLNSYRDLFDFYFDAVWSSVPDVNNYLKNDFNNSEWYISKSNFGSMRPYFPIVRRYSTAQEHSSNNSGDSLTVTFSGGGHNGSGVRTIPITNQDESIEDYTYYKIELPYATDVLTGNKKYWTNGNYTMSFNGWRLKKVVANGVEYTSQGSIIGMGMDYTFRNKPSSLTKNINEVFSEGGYYLVPDGVTALEFEAVWAYTVFLSDDDVQKTFNARTYEPTTYRYRYNNLSNNSGLDVYHPVGSLAAAYDVINSFPNNTDRYNNVIMLVGNYHQSYATSDSTVLDATWGAGSSHNDLPVTIKSADWQDDKKPDYTMFVRNPTRMAVNGGLRFDYINLLGIPQVAGYSGGLGSFFLADDINFEVTETVVTDHITLFTQNADFVKILGGYYDIYTGYNAEYNLNNRYLVFGGKARAGDVVSTSLFDTNFTGGDSKNKENGRVINIIGGRANHVSYDIGPVLAYFGKVNAYIDGGYINNYYSLYMGEAQYKVNTVIHNAYINNCYGGGFADSSYALQGVNFSIDNARIGTLFGGPKYGEISGVLDLNVKNSVIDTVYGGGYGGTEYFTLPSGRYSNTTGDLNVGKYTSDFMDSGKGTHTLYIQFYGDNKGFKTVNYKTKVYSYNGVVYTYVEDQMAYLSNSSVNGVTFDISDSKVKGNIYGGGNRGFTTADIRFNLHNVEVLGNIFGAGYSDNQDTVQVNERKSKTAATFINYAIDNEHQDSTTTTYQWAPGGDIYNIGIHEGSKTIDSLNTGNSGTVTASNIYVNISGDSNGKYPMRVHGDVYGGGNMADVQLSNGNSLGEIHVNINDGVTIDGSVYGGGNLHSVTANTNVIIENYDDNNQTVIKGGVYAAGNSAAVLGSATVTIAGNPKVNNVFGGGNNASATESNVYIEGGDIENVYGGSNSSGTIDNSHVYVGKHSPALKNDGYVETYDFCQNRAFNVWIDGNNGADGTDTIIHIENLTNINFDNYTIKVYFTGETASNIGSATLDGWTGTNNRTYSGGVLTINQFDMWGTHATHNLNSHGEISVSALFKVNNSKVNIDISDITFEGYSGRDRFEFEGCPIQQFTGNSGNYVTVQDLSSVPTPTRLGNIKVNNVFGGNNVGGYTKNTNILVLGQDPNWTGDPYTVEVKNVFGGGNATVTGEHPNHRSRVVINGAHITGSVYGSSNGDPTDATNEIDATMYAMPYVLIANNSQIDGHVYGGGYAADAPVGKGAFDTSTYVYLDSGTINKNVYGGGFGDTVLGSTNVWAGLPSDIKSSVVSIFGINDANSMFYNTPLSSTSNQTTVHIKGTLFGGSETGAKDGSYDYTTESVHKGISVYVEDFPNVCTVNIDGSIFGSGNYSSSGGYSDVFIKNWGTASNPKKMASIQRTKNLYINNSALMLSGASDVTNKFNKVKYSFNAIEDMKIGDSSTIYTSAQANLLKKWYSYNGQTDYVDSRLPSNDSNREKSNGVLSNITYNQNNTITVDDDEKVIVTAINGSTTDTHSNRLYLFNNRGLNILTSEEIGEGFGNVYGMTFLGVYTMDGDTINTTYFDKQYDITNNGISGVTKTDYSGYVLGGNRVVNKQNMDYFTHGFYTNTYYENDGSPVIKTTVINPTPNNQAYYYWNIGVPSIIMEIDLTASKYIRSGMKSVSMYQYSGYHNVSFDIASVDVSGLTTDADFINPSAVPNIAENNSDALKTFGLSVETSETGWVNEGHTYIDSSYNNGNRTGDIEGTIKYDTSGSENIPKFIVNIENSRNIRDNVSLGTVVLTINAHAFTSNDQTTPINSVIKLYINLDTEYYPDDDYESSIAPGKHYKSFLTSKTNITTTSEFSTYFNMYAYDKDIYAKARTDYNTDNIDHVLYTTYVLPAGTRITMLDISTNDPKYYYYIVDGNEPLGPKLGTKYNQESATFYSYPLSWFKAMDTTSGDNTYDELKNQARYVIPDGNVQSTIEQFIFMVDFGNVTDHTKPISQIKGEEFYLGLRATTDGNSYIFSWPMSETMKDMNYSIFNASDATFNLELEDTPTEDSPVYVDDVFEFKSHVTVHESSITDPELGNLVVRNTSYYQDRLGLRIGLYHITEDEHGNERATLVSGDELAGATFYVDGVGYAPGSNGFVRLKLADYVVNINKDIRVDLSNADHLTSGLYEFRVTALASSDGLYAKQGDTITNSSDSFRVNLVNENYGLLSTVDDDKDVIIYSDGKTSGGTDKVEVTLNYFGSYTNPNVKVSLKRRDYTSVNSYNYNDVNIGDYFDLSSTTFSDTSQLDATNLFDISTMTISKNALTNHINSGNMGNYKMSFKLKNTGNLPTGTYRLVFTLYNGTKEIGDVYSYLIIKD